MAKLPIIFIYQIDILLKNIKISKFAVMNKTGIKIMAIGITLGTLTACQGNGSDFTYTVDSFADISVSRYQVPGWDSLSLQQKEYAYHLSQAALFGRDIRWDQNCQGNLELRKVLEKILTDYKGDKVCQDYKDFLVYAKRVFFSSGMHHHYAEDKFFPACSEEYFASLMKSVGLDSQVDAMTNYIYNPLLYPQRRATNGVKDIVMASAVNYYGQGITRQEAEAFYDKIPNDTASPVLLGLNSKLVKDANGNLKEEVWNIGSKYGPAIREICRELELAAACAENDQQRKVIGLLIEYYKTGDLKTWDQYNIEWVKENSGMIDFINGFIETYNDPLDRRGTWEGYIELTDAQATRRTQIISSNAQWFEDHAPVDDRFKKKECKGVTAKVINAICVSGDSYPTSPIGINLPNSNWIRKEYGSKSVTIANVTASREYSSLEQPNSTLQEFAYSKEEIEQYRKYGFYADQIHTDLHECLGHGSGQLLPGVSENALGEYASTLEEGRADLFGLYYAADPKMVELGIMPDKNAYKALYSSYIRNGLMVQLSRIEPGKNITEAHMQNRKFIAEWCYEKGAADGVIERMEKDGKTYFVIKDYKALRALFAQLLAEVQRIKSTGDYQAGKDLVENYGVKVDPELHKEVLDRYKALDLKPYGGVVNPTIVPVEKDGRIVDYKLVPCADFISQQLEYARLYSTL